MKNFIRISLLFMLFVTSFTCKSLNAQSQKVFYGNHLEYCCRDSRGTFTDCDDPDYSNSYTITITNTEIKIARRYSDGELLVFKFKITGKKFCAPDNVWYFDVIDEDGYDDIVGVSRNGDFLMLFDVDDDENICTLVYYMHE